MKKIFDEHDDFDPVTYSESYIVSFWYLLDNGYWCPMTKRYFAASKNAHRAVQGKWEKDYPSANLVKIEYE